MRVATQSQRRWNKYGPISVPELPERLKRNGRAADQEFAAAEKLFRRYTKLHYVDGQFTGIGLNLESPPSTNREKYSEPADVLFSPTNQYAGWGVLSLAVQDITITLPTDQARYSFSPKHMPLEDNYAHAEIWCDLTEPTGQHVEPSPGVRKLFRTIIGQRATREIEATV
jgi:hypothetical protein